MSTAATIDPVQVRDAGFELAGEPIALDLVNTEKRAVNPARDLLGDDDANRAFWALQANRLSIPAELPTLDQVRPLRNAIRALLESRLADRAPEPWATQAVNRMAATAIASPRLTADWNTELEWSAPDGPTALLSAVARSAIDVLTGPDAARLRRCASDDCSMLFVATNAKRQWCSSAGCGNRHRVARHADRLRASAISAPANNK
jgi:predicted RNA-binding Zn ribbon-like protein